MILRDVEAPYRQAFQSSLCRRKTRYEALVANEVDHVPLEAIMGWRRLALIHPPGNSVVVPREGRKSAARCSITSLPFRSRSTDFQGAIVRCKVCFKKG